MSVPIQMCPTEQVALHSPLPKAPGSGHQGNRIHPWAGVGVGQGGDQSTNPSGGPVWWAEPGDCPQPQVQPFMPLMDVVMLTLLS